jgi:hypothetical protein
MDDGETREEVPMKVMILQQAEREAQRVQANREELVERIGRAMRDVHRLREAAQVSAGR